MKEEIKIREKYGTSAGWRVPDDYFDKFRNEMLGNLPEYPEKPREQQLSRWQRVKPYVYLAAMFAGIWMMMQIFGRASGMGQLNLDNPPEQIAQIMSTPEVASEFVLPSTLNDIEVEEEVSGSYSNIADFEEDFGYELEPEYDKIKL